MKNRVAIVLPYFALGGAETMVSRLASNINLDKIDVEVICIYGNPQNNRLENSILNSEVKIEGYVHQMRKLKYVTLLPGSLSPAIQELRMDASPFKREYMVSGGSGNW